MGITLRAVIVKHQYCILTCLALGTNKLVVLDSHQADVSSNTWRNKKVIFLCQAACFRADFWKQSQAWLLGRKMSSQDDRVHV